MWTQALFVQEAQALLVATAALDRDNKDRNDDNNYRHSLSAWLVGSSTTGMTTTNHHHHYHGDSDDDAFFFLQTNPIQRRMAKKKMDQGLDPRKNKDNSNMVLLSSLEEDHLFADEDLAGNMMEHIDNQQQDYISTRWTFSICFSDIWHCPVLYFRVERAETGELVDRNDVVQQLLWYNGRCQTKDAETEQQQPQPEDQQQHHNQHEQNEEEDASWDMVSYEQHPVTGVPSFFLHPCQTNARMEQLLLPSPLSKPPLAIEEAGAEIEVEHNNGGDTDNPPTTSPAASTTPIHKSSNKLLSWMSLIFPTVGLVVSTQEFVALQRRLESM